MARNTPQEQHIFDPGSRTDVMSNQKPVRSFRPECGNDSDVINTIS